ncbi:hypothetical protein CBR_g34871 [Chara braunii]|uniref:Uncharacterized protein n=1 Tax=Chara braunii TaxID=69332 RepID=A0A388LJT6_CHABU|nr:hypothetical protein CBR_g34871 [Chara braunii]|eukprot:GBG82495.1 hypothetical protein CBR_g34871 [Chara braunii]
MVMGRLVRENMKIVCEKALGKKVDWPEEGDSEVSRLRRELEELKSLHSDCDNSSELERLKKERDDLLRKQEEERLRKQVEGLRKGKIQTSSSEAPSTTERQEIASLKHQIEDLKAIHYVLEEKNNEVATLRAENSHLRSESRNLKDEVCVLNKRSAEAVTEKRPPEELAKGKTKVADNFTTMYTPKDMETLRKAYKDALVSKQWAQEEVCMLKERYGRKMAGAWKTEACVLNKEDDTT